MKAEINRSVELVQVLLLLAERQDKTFQCLNNKQYADSITKRFAPFKDHAAVQLTRELIINKNLVHIEPLCAILSLDAIASDINHELHDWGTAAEKFIADTDFDDFFAGQEPYYKWITDTVGE